MSLIKILLKIINGKMNNMADSLNHPWNMNFFPENYINRSVC